MPERQTVNLQASPRQVHRQKFDGLGGIAIIGGMTQELVLGGGTGRTRKARWPRWAPHFLLELAKHGIMGKAAEAAGINRETAYRLRRADADFRAKWDDAIEAAYDGLEQMAWSRATDPADPGFDPSPSTGLLKWLLEAYRPGKFKRALGVHVGPVYNLKVGDYPVREIRSLDDLNDLTDAELEQVGGSTLTVEEESPQTGDANA